MPMFLRFVGLVAILLCVIPFVLAQERWTERMLAKVMAKRPPNQQLTLWSGGAFHFWSLYEACRKADPAEFWRGIPRSLMFALFWMATMWWLMRAIGMR